MLAHLESRSFTNKFIRESIFRMESSSSIFGHRLGISVSIRCQGIVKKIE
jgi:hypothetical protein